MTENENPLRDFVETGSEHAFGLLVSRHFDLVYSAALRIVGGDAHLAQDVAQNVFADLARKAKRLAPGTIVPGWLHRHACFTAANAVRTERRRQARERQAVEMNAQNELSADALWKQLAPTLDEALARLSMTDRDALVLHFFEHQPFRAVGDSLGTSEDAARKRVDRALDKLRAHFNRRGLTVSASVLALALGSQAVTAAPAGIAATVTTASFAGATAAGSHSTSVTLLKLIAMTTKAKIAITVAIAAVATTAVVVEVAKTTAHSETTNQTQSVSTTSMGFLGDPMVSTNSPASVDRLGLSSEEARQESVARMNLSKQVALAVIMFADEHGDQVPATLDQVLRDIDPSLQQQATNLFELVYRGPLRIQDPGRVAILREKSPRHYSIGWNRAYAFADGHAEGTRSGDGSYATYESQHILKSAAR